MLISSMRGEAARGIAGCGTKAWLIETRFIALVTLFKRLEGKEGKFSYLPDTVMILASRYDV